MTLPRPKQQRRYFHHRTWRITFRESLVGLCPRTFRLVKFYERRNPAIHDGWEQIHYAVQEGPRPML
jgi:hypothetical protein